MAIFDRKEDYLYVRWADAVKKRDHYCCQICGARGSLNSHHIRAWASYPDERYDVDNGVTLCSGSPTSCHELFHSIYGKGDNDDVQFDEFVKMYEIIKKSAVKISKIKSISENVLKKLKKDFDGYA